MIRIDFVTAVGVYVVFVLVVFMLLWLFLWRRNHFTKEWNMTDHIRRCPYCGQVFADEVCVEPIKCPLCESYLEVPDVGYPNEK